MDPPTDFDMMTPSHLTTSHPATTRQPSALPQLFALYVTGRIADASWTHMMDAIDEGVQTPEEREGLARFFADAFGEVGPEGMKVPPREEVEEVLGALRAN